MVRKKTFSVEYYSDEVLSCYHLGYRLPSASAKRRLSAPNSYGHIINCLLPEVCSTRANLRRLVSAERISNAECACLLHRGRVTKSWRRSEPILDSRRLRYVRVRSGLGDTAPLHPSSFSQLDHSQSSAVGRGGDLQPSATNVRRRRGWHR